jgi:hypothetical protein
MFGCGSGIASLLGLSLTRFERHRNARNPEIKPTAKSGAVGQELGLAPIPDCGASQVDRPADRIASGVAVSVTKLCTAH